MNHNVIWLNRVQRFRPSELFRGLGADQTSSSQTLEAVLEQGRSLDQNPGDKAA